MTIKAKMQPSKAVKPSQASIGGTQRDPGPNVTGSAKDDRLAKEIGKRIFEARDGLGLSQQALHGRTKQADPEKQGISRAVLSLYETGGSKPGAREIRILCESLKITPNWLLYGTDTPARALQASLAFLHGSDLALSVRLSFALIALDPVERDALASLIFSSLTKKLGDTGLSSLMVMAGFEAEEILKKVLDVVGKEAKDRPLSELLDIFVQQHTEAFYTNVGTLRPSIPEDQLNDFDPEKPPPPRKLKGSRLG